MTRKKKSRKFSELLNLYSQKLAHGIESKLSPLGFELHFQYRSPHIAYISGYVTFRTGWILEFDEIIKQERTVITKVKYRYHLMNEKKELLFRYDNVAHFPKIKTYPHHKHIQHEVTESSAPELFEVIEEIETLVVKENKRY